MEEGIRVSEVMTKDVVTVDVKTSIMEVAQLIKKHRVGSAVVTKSGKPLGIVTERDMVEKTIASDLIPSKTLAGEVMSTPLISVLPKTSVYEASRIMLKRNIRRLVVINETDELVGIVTVVDVLSVSRELSEIYDDLIIQRRQRPFTNLEDNSPTAEEYEQGICESCGGFSEDIKDVNGRLLCESCRSYMTE